MLPKPERKRDGAVLEQRRHEPCSVCGRAPTFDKLNDASHIRSRGAGGPDTLWNCVSHCRRCHIEWGNNDHETFFKLHPEFDTYLRSLGWGRSLDGRKLAHPGLEL